MTKLHLDDLERKALSAEQDEWQWRPANEDILEGKHTAQLVLAAGGDDDLICSISDRAHIAANSPPVTLALIARVRELELALHAAADVVRDRGVEPWGNGYSDEWRRIAQKGAVLR
jgi:hypothetical protein